MDLVTAGWPVNYATQTISANGSAQYQIASGAPVFSVRAVWHVQGGNRTPVQRVQEDERSSLLGLATTGDQAKYEILVDATEGTVLRLYPAVSGTFEVEYLAEVEAFADDDARWFGPAGSDELLCLLAAAKGCRKEGRRGDAADLLQDYATQLEKVINRAGWVDQRNVPRIRDVMAPNRHPFDYPAIGPDTY